MKKAYSFILLVVVSASLIAQPTLTTSNFVPAINDNQLYYVADTNSVIDPTIGPNVVFSYGNLAGYGMTQNQFIINPATTPNAGDFPSASYADTSNAVANNTRYSEVAGLDSLLNIGFVAQIPTYGTLIAKYDQNPEVLMKFPFNYGDNYVDPYSGTFTLQLTGTNTDAEGNASITADAWGQLQLPYGVVIDSVLRVTTIEYVLTDTIVITFPPATIDPVEINATYINYYKPSLSKFPLLSYVEGTIAQGATIVDSNRTFVSQYPLYTVGVEELENNLTEFEIFPNPTNRQVVKLNLNLKENSSLKIELINKLGQKVKTIHNTNNVILGNKQFEINTNDLPAGVYFVNVFVNGTGVAKKLIIQ